MNIRRGECVQCLKIPRELIWIPFVFLILMTTCQSSVIDSFGSENARISPEHLSVLWSSFLPKPTPVYLCHGWYGGNKLVIPKKPDCNAPMENGTDKIVKVSLFLPDVSKQSTKAFECYALKTEGYITVGFLGAKTTVAWRTKTELTPKQCFEMIETRKAPNGKIMEHFKDGIFGTNDKLEIESEMWNTKYGEVTNYFFQNLSVSTFAEDDTVLSSTEFLEPCKYKQGYCPTTLGIMVWTMEEYKSCRLTQLEKTNCVFRKSENHNRLTCPDLQLTLQDLSLKTMCGLIFGTSSQGFYFLQDAPGEIDDVMSITDEATAIISQPLKHKISKREAPQEDIINPMEIFNNAKFSFLYETMKDNLLKAFRIIHDEICQLSLMTWNSLVGDAHDGNPSRLVQTLYKDDSLRAAFSGDALSVWRCKEIIKYKFVPRRKCIYEYPIEYITDNGEQISAYVAPLSHSIVHAPIELPEPCSEFYFNAGDYMLQLTPEGPKHVSLPTIPIPDINIGHFKFPEITFDSTSGFDISGYSDHVTAVTIANEKRRRNLILQNYGVAQIEDTGKTYNWGSWGGGGGGGSGGSWGFWSWLDFSSWLPAPFNYIFWLFKFINPFTILSFVWNYFWYLVIGIIVLVCIKGFLILSPIIWITTGLIGVVYSSFINILNCILNWLQKKTTTTVYDANAEYNSRAQALPDAVVIGNPYSDMARFRHVPSRAPQIYYK